MEKQNSQLEQRQPMEPIRGLFCMCDSGVARCQSQHQCNFWRINLDVRSALHGQLSFTAVNQICAIHEAMNGCKKKSKDSLNDCFKNVNIII